LAIQQLKKRTELLAKLRVVFRSFRSQPVERVIVLINPILRGWVKSPVCCSVRWAARAKDYPFAARIAASMTRKPG
jgi:hypothetical protein